MKINLLIENIKGKNINGLEMINVSGCGLNFLQSPFGQGPPSEQETLQIQA